MILAPGHWMFTYSKVILMELRRQAQSKLVTKSSYAVLANFISRSISPLDPGRYHKVMATYQAGDAEEAFRMFLEEYAKDLDLAQRFYDQVYVVRLTEEPRVFNISSVFGRGKFPNPAVMTEDNIPI